MQPRGFLRMHIFMDGMRIVWRACRCSVDATRIYSRASKRKGARSARARSTPRAPIDPPPSAGLSCSTTGSPSLRVSPPRVHFSSVPKDAGETSGGGMEREPFSILLRVLRSCRCDTRRETTSSSTLSLSSTVNQFRRSFRSTYAKGSEEDEDRRYFFHGDEKNR